MKNLEKISIDTLIEKFNTKFQPMINDAISAKNAVEIAQENFKKVASPLLAASKDSMHSIIEEIGDDAITYAENTLSAIVKLPVKLK